MKLSLWVQDIVCCFALGLKKYIVYLDDQNIKTYIHLCILNLFTYYLMGSSESKNIIYNVPVVGSQAKGFSAIYRNPLTPQDLVYTPSPTLGSMKDVIYQSCAKNLNRPFLGKIVVKSATNSQGTVTEQRQLVSFTYGQIMNYAERVGSYLLANRMQFNQPLYNMRLIGIFSKNRYEWLVADMACMLYGLTIVPLYDTLGIQNLTYCLQHSGITTLFVTQGTIKTILGLKGHGNLQNLIVFDDIPAQTQNMLKSHKFRVFHFNQLVQYNSLIDHRNVAVTAKNCLTFSYTSGTTGPPKGAMLSHGNFLAFLAAIQKHQIQGFRPDDVYVSFLPLPHVMERVIVAQMINKGSFIAFYCGDIMKFKDDVAFVKPTIFIAVPRIYNRIVQGVQKQMSQSSTGIKGCLINNGTQSKMDQLHSDGTFESFFYDKIVFSKVKDKFGGRIRLMITGSAPIKKQTFEYMKIIMSCPFYQGYGQTQNTAAAFLQNSIDHISGHVGGVAADLQFKLADIQQMHYTSLDRDQQGRPTPRGQIWLRGPGVFMGYYKDKQKTDEAITSDGWLKTGDVGMLMPGTNAMKIIDRKKNIFKLQQGEYVAAQKVQGIYTKSHLVTQAFLHGQSHHNFAVAILVLNKDQLMKLASKNNIQGPYEQVIRDKGIRTLIVKQLDSIGKQSGLNSFQQAKNIHVQPDSFAARNILSSTMKLQRFAAKKYYAKQIEDMYNEGPLLNK